MTVSNKKKLEIENLTQPTDTKKEIFQQGGKITMKEWIKSANTNALPSIKRDNTNAVRTDLITNSKPALGRDQGTISAYNKSPRERLMSGLHKLSNTGTTAGDVTSVLVGAPVMSGAKLLRPDNYFKGVGSDNDIKDALLEIGGDLLNVAPVVGIGAKVGKPIARAFAEARSPYTASMKKAWNATSDLPLIKRGQNALKASTLGKSLEGDVAGYNYFNMSPEQTATKIKGDVSVLPGTRHTETSLSYNSAPIYWNKATQLAGAKNSKWSIVRSGGIDETNFGGVNGKRIFDAIPNSLKDEHADLLAHNSLKKHMYKEQLNQGGITKQAYRNRVSAADNSLNTALMDPLMLSELNGEGRYTEFLQNYKPQMDAGIEKVNALTGLNFPMSKIKAEGGYELPNLVGINDLKQRSKTVFKDILGNTRDNITLNREINNAVKKKDNYAINALKDYKEDAKFEMYEPGRLQRKLDVTRTGSKIFNMNLDDLTKMYDGQ